MRQNHSKDTKSLEVLFPLWLFNPTQALLDPYNTENVFEYYLLENLACGLVRDSRKSPLGYEGCIADRFYQETPQSWTFHIKPLRWSDGSFVTQQEIIEWIDNLRKKDTRHIQFLKLATSVAYDDKTRNLKIIFPFDVDTSLLHEMSLADSSLIPTNFESRGWSKTVGPYAVSKWDSSNNILQLISNKFSPLYRSQMPQAVNLWWLKDANDRERLFKSIPVDVVMASPISNLPKTRELIQNAPQIFLCHPTSIGYFFFNHENKLSLVKENRLKFSAIIAKVREAIDHKLKGKIGTHRSIDQMMPEGFNGRLPSVPVIEDSSVHSLISITLRFPTVFAQWPEFCAELVRIFKADKINAKLEFEDFKPLSSDIFASLYVFQGNQNDPSGSWTFLTGAPQGKLNPWRSEYNQSYKRAFDLASISNKKANFENLHLEILKNAIAVPLLVGETRYLLSEKVDATEWNKFDARMRFYQLSWK